MLTMVIVFILELFTFFTLFLRYKTRQKLTISPLNVGIILRNDLLILECEWSIRVPFADRMVSQ